MVYFQLKLVKIADFLKMYKIIFMFHFINRDIPDEPKRLFIIYTSIHCYGTSSMNKFDKIQT